MRQGTYVSRARSYLPASKRWRRRVYGLDMSFTLDTQDRELTEALAAFFSSCFVTVESMTAEELPYGVMNPVTHALHRIHGSALVDGEPRTFSMIRKTMGLEPTGRPNVSFEMSNEPRHWNYWKRELLMYQSSLISAATAPLKTPFCYVTSQPDDEHAVIWLKEITSLPAERWTIARTGIAARHLGQWQAQYINAQLPSEEWSSQRVLRDLVSTRLRAEVRIIDDESKWRVPLVQRLFDPSLRSRVVDLWNSREVLLKGLDGLPQALTHHDFRIPNLFDGTDENETVVIDWQFAGEGAVGQDLASLIIDSLFTSYIVPNDLIPLETIAFEQYVAGLRLSGWDGDQEEVWMAYAATSALRFALASGWLILLASNDEASAVQERRYGRAIPELMQHRLVAVERSLELGAQAVAYFR